MARSSFLNRLWVGGAVAVMRTIVAFPMFASAQVVADPSIGTIVTPNGTTFQITGGTVAGNRNLFHSFSRFDVPTGGVADFLNDPNIVNIFSRVTGGTASQIDGIVRSAGIANLFLMNPNGIIFGQNAQLDVGGSFVATTANSIQFGDRGSFNASPSKPPSQLLTVAPSAFLFSRANIAPILSNSASLSVGDGQSLVLLGGDVILDNSFLGIADVVGGRAELGGLATSGRIDLAINGGLFRLSFPNDVLRGDVTLKNGSTVNVIAGNSGSISVHARNLSVLGGSSLVAGISSGLGSPNSQAGDIVLDTTGITEVNQSSFIENNVYQNADGKSGNIHVMAGSLSISSGADLGTFILGKGKAGDVVVDVKDGVAIDGTSPSGRYSSGIFSNVNSGAAGNGGNLKINTQSLVVRDGARVSASIYGEGNAGSLTISATDSIKVTGTSSDGRTLSKLVADVYQGAQGQGGNLIIKTPQLVVADGGQVGASTFGKGNAGNVTVNADVIDLYGFSPHIGNDYYPAGLFTEVKGEGNGGKLTITTRNLSISDGARISGISFGSGDAGAVTINSSGLVQVIGSSPDAYFLSKIATDVGQGGIGKGGDLTINAPNLIVKDGGQISSSTFGKGNAGTLTANAGFISLQGFSPDNEQNGYYPAGLFTEVKGEGHGGQLKVTTDHLSITDGARISAITFGKGDAGDVSINASEVVEVVGTSPDLVFLSKIATDVGQGATGNSGNLTITLPKLIVSKGAQISSSTFGKGNAGNLTIYASNSVELSGESGSNGYPGGLFAQVDENGVGHGGNLFLEAKHLSASNGSKVQVATFGDGNAGNLLIHVDAIDLFNIPNANNFFSTAINAGVTRDPRFIRQPVGNGGDLMIETERLSIRDGAEVTVDTSGKGNAGRLIVQAKDLVEVVGQSSFLTADVNSGATGQGGSLTIEASRLSIRDGGQVGSSTFGIGNAGDVFVRATDIDILGSAANGNPSGLFSTSSQNARGNGGNLFVEAGNLNLSDSGRLSAQSRGAGTGGNITVNARNIRMRSNSDILTISNSGDGGNITLNAQTIVALENSDILAFAPAGKGGNITFKTRVFLSDPLYRPSPAITNRAALFALLTNNQVDVNASGTVSGTVSGVPDITFLQNSLTQLAQNLIDPNTLLANSCIVRNREQNGSFLITGSGGLPVRPGDAPSASFPTGEVRSLPAPQSQNDRPWQLGDAIVEPQGIYRLPNGKLVMSRECQTQ